MNWIDVLIDVPEAHRVAAASFWGSALGWPLGRPEPGHPEFASFQPSRGASDVHLQTLGATDDEPRVHLDLTVADLDAEADRLEALGASSITRPGDDPGGFRPMRSPGGLLFCLLPTEPSRTYERPPAVRQPNGVRTRLVQVCVDSPAALHDAEVAFWTAATGWSLRPSRHPEFAGTLLHPDSPLQVLLQRLADDAPESVTRVHLDLGADDVAAEAIRLGALGAERLSGPVGALEQDRDTDTPQSWVVLRDPVGLPFCVVDIDPGDAS